jgi:two-component system nitrogen regulation sensor histidine kinase NtrY
MKQNSSLFRKKTVDQILKDAHAAENGGLAKILGVRDLVSLGIAAIVGAGIFSTIGVASYNGGPAVSLLFIFTAIACVFTALSYAQFASTVPVSGSAYTYAYVAFGELFAWIIGWSLILEYAVSNMVVAISWSEYFTGMLKGFGIVLPGWLTVNHETASDAFAKLQSAGAAEMGAYERFAAAAYESSPVIGDFHIMLNLPAGLVTLLITALVYIGIRESRTASNIMVVLKIGVVLLVIFAGAFYVKPENWSPFAPNGIKGVMGGVASVFFAFIGFDSISTTAEECKNPQRDMPKAMIYCLIICTVLYVLGTIFIFVQGSLLYQYVTNVNRKLTYFLESVRYSDFTINFRSDNKMGRTFKELNQQFNEVLHAFRQARAEKEANLQYLNTIVQHIGTGLITFDSNGQVNLINNAALRMLGIYRLHQLSELKDKHPRLYELLSTLDSGVRELYRTPSDQPLALQGAAIQLRGMWVRIVVLQNIQTELQQQEVESWQNLTRVLRHEIMNSMTPIVSLVGTMRLIVNEDIEKSTNDQEAVNDLKEALHTLEKRSKGMMQFVNAYRDFTTLPKPVFANLSVAELLHEVIQLLQTDLTVSGVLWKISVKPETLTVKADASQIQQVLINLVKNASEAFSNQTNRLITLTAYQTDNVTIIDVADNGDGIEPEAIENIFIPFYTTKKTGSGIGLSLSRQILQQHNGQLNVSSEVGKGTVFTLLI